MPETRGVPLERMSALLGTADRPRAAMCDATHLELRHPSD